MIRVIFFSMILGIMGCKDVPEKPKASSKTEIIEIYDTVYDGEGFSKGNMTHYESRNYKDGKQIETYFYTPNGEVKGYEIIKYKDSDSGKSTYYDGNNQPLSYYQIEYDDMGRKIQSHSYDAKNDELLRIEKFRYQGEVMKKKEILDANGVAQRIFEFNHDAYGNETEMYVLQAISGDTIARQRYEITKIDKNNKWLEKWGFQNDRPTTYHVRK